VQLKRVKSKHANLVLLWSLGCKGLCPSRRQIQKVKESKAMSALALQGERSVHDSMIFPSFWD